MKIGRDIKDDDSNKPEEVVTEVKKSSVALEFFNTCCTLLNLAISQLGKNGGWPRGRISNVVGDGSSGKTMLCLEVCAWLFHNWKKIKSKYFPQIKKIKIIYDNVEGVMDFPIEEMYGKEFKESVFPKPGSPDYVRSSTVQEWGRRLTREIDANKPGECLLYILDSLDALCTSESQKRFDEAAKKGKDEDGSYGAGAEKAKYLSDSFFGNICDKMEGKDVTLIIVSQIREAMGITYGKKYKRNGGKALNFYTHVVPWLYTEEKMKRTFRGEDRVYGVRTRAVIERSKVSKPFREAEFQILFDYGLDDISSCLAYLYGPKVEKINWDNLSKKEIEAGGRQYGRAELISKIETENLQDELIDRTEKAWNEVENAIKPDRAKRY